MQADSYFLGIGAGFEVLAQLTLWGLLLGRSFRRDLSDRVEWVVVGLLHLGTAGVALGFDGAFPWGWAAPAVSLLAVVGISSFLPNDRPVRALALANAVLSTVVSVAGLVRGVTNGDLSSMTGWLSLIIGSISLVALALALLIEVFHDSVQLYPLYRKHSLRPTEPLPARTERFPKVSIHVPCYCEPTDVLIRTLDALAKLRYPNYEVLVIDNNTKDPALWRPVEAHCARLGPVFRFFHVDPLAGAKGGALNFAMKQLGPDVEIIASIDADYVARPEFLEELVGFFDDPKTGYVQTPHDYREWEENPFLRAAYWQYAPHFRLRLPSRNEQDASQIAGTMVLVRRSALEAVGGWSETCLTEDSELSVRLHAHGYTGQYLNKPYGKGLIPETFAEYQRQRFRWSAGPVQEMKMNWRKLLPRPFAEPSALSTSQKLAILSNGLEHAGALFEQLLLAVAVVASTVLVTRGERVHLSFAAVTMTATAVLSSLGMAVIRSRLIGRSFRDSLRAAAAHLSLYHVKSVATLATLVSNRPLAWHRTNKFKARWAGWSALRSAERPTALGVAALILGAWFLGAGQWSQPDLVLLTGFALMFNAVRWLSAPYMTWLSERELQPAAPMPALARPRRVVAGGFSEPYLAPSIHGIGRLAVGPMYAWAPHALSDRDRENPSCPIEVTRSRE